MYIIPLLLHLLYSVNGVIFHNPPRLPPEVFKLSERYGKLIFEKLEGNEARDLIRDVKSGGLEDGLSVLKDIKVERIDDKVKDFINDLTLHRSQITNFQNKYNKNNKGLKRVLVKRIVPHGSKSPKYEYDYNFKTLYTPIARVHTNLRNGSPENRIASQNDDLFVRYVDNNEMLLNRVLNGKYLIDPLKDKISGINKGLTEESVDPAKDNTIFVKKLGKTFELNKDFDDNHLLEPFQVESDELKFVKNEKLADEISFRDETRSNNKINNQFIFIRNIGNKFELDSKFNDNYLLDPFKLQTDVEKKLLRINKLRDRNSELDTDGDNYTAEILGIVAKIQHLAKAVKSPQLKVMAFNKVLEALDDIQGLRMGLNDPPEENKEGEAEVEENVVNKPSHHHFNYWTYKKEIYENECPGQLVKIGNVCSWIPPH